MAFSTMGNPNFLGSYLVLMLPIPIYLYIVKNQRFALAGFGILFLGLLCTMTRGTWLGAIFSVGSFCLLHYYFYKYKQQEIKRYIILFIFAIFIVLLLNFQTDSLLLDRFLSISNDAHNLLADNEMSEMAGSYRYFIWKRVIEMISMRPIFGFGIGSLGAPFTELYKKDMLDIIGSVITFDKAHNEYLHIAVSSGIPSLIAYLTFIFFTLKRGWMRLTNNQYALPLMASVLGYLVQAFFNISVVSVAYVFWAFLGLLVSSSYVERANS